MANVVKREEEYTKILQTNLLARYNMGMATRLQKKILKKKKEKKREKENKTASPPVQDFYPDSDRIRGTMLYPLSCGELAMYEEQI